MEVFGHPGVPKLLLGFSLGPSFREKDPKKS